MPTHRTLYRLPLAGSLTLAVFGIAACDNDPAKGKSTASVAEPVAVQALAPSSVATKYTFSAADSKLAFTGAKVTRKHEGSFGAFTGTIQLIDNSPEKGSVRVDVDMPSLSADDPKLAGHLQSADFFDAAKFPKARFVSTSVKAGGEKGASHTVTGNLEMHGVTKSITFPATIKSQGDSVDVDAEFVIDRKDFGVVYPGAPDDLIKDEILIKLQVRAKKPS
jgi:polyisoprenoid-binding protein YceI